MSKKLLTHFRSMQRQAGAYIEPGSYHTVDDVEIPETAPSSMQDAAFMTDMIYMLDGPEQREAQADAEFDYLAESERTASGEFHGELIDFNLFVRALGGFVYAAQVLDRYKKLAFYGESEQKRRYGDAPGKWTGADVTAALSHDEESQYRAEFIIHGILGISSEAGELVEALLACLQNPEVVSLDTINLAEEIGDCQWYEAMLCRAIGTDFDTIQRTNIAKLRARFPDKFTSDKANDRDLTAERAILEEGHEVGAGFEMLPMPPEGVKLPSVLDEPDVAAVIERTHTQFEGTGLEDVRPGLRDNLGLPLEGTKSVRREPPGVGTSYAPDERRLPDDDATGE